jgi:hypothetical protein
MQPLVRAGFVLGLGFGGFADGIVLHQILGWHHLVCVSALAGPQRRPFLDLLSLFVIWWMQSNLIENQIRGATVRSEVEGSERAGGGELVGCRRTGATADKSYVSSCTLKALLLVATSPARQLAQRKPFYGKRSIGSGNFPIRIVLRPLRRLERGPLPNSCCIQLRLDSFHGRAV